MSDKKVNVYRRFKVEKMFSEIEKNSKKNIFLLEAFPKQFMFLGKIKKIRYVGTKAFNYITGRD